MKQSKTVKKRLVTLYHGMRNAYVKRYKSMHTNSRFGNAMITVGVQKRTEHCIKYIKNKTFHVEKLYV
jgi:hypothetical protein